MSTLSRAPVVHLLMADRSSFLMITCDTAAPESKCSTAFAQRGDLCVLCLAETMLGGLHYQAIWQCCLHAAAAAAGLEKRTRPARVPACSSSVDAEERLGRPCRSNSIISTSPESDRPTSLPLKWPLSSSE